MTCFVHIEARKIHFIYQLLLFFSKHFFNIVCHSFGTIFSHIFWRNWKNKKKEMANVFFIVWVPICIHTFIYHIPIRVGTLLENTRLEITRSLKSLRVLARKNSKFIFSPNTRLGKLGKIYSSIEYPRVYSMHKNATHNK